MSECCIKIPSPSTVTKPVGYEFRDDPGPEYYVWTGQIPAQPFEDLGAFMWDGSLTPPAPRAWTSYEILDESRKRKLAALEAVHISALAALYEPSVLTEVALNLPTASFAAVVKQDVLAMRAALNGARAAVKVATLADLDGISAQYPAITPADPDDAQYQE